MRMPNAAVVVAAASITSAQQQPNFIVLQPDDLRFFEEWTPPPHFDGNQAQIENFPAVGLPNMERLRTNGLQMMQAYTASPMCGTSRYSTLTGRYPSRSSYSRIQNADQEIGDVVIPNSKLQDEHNVADGNDCSSSNIPTVLQQNGYRTGMVGKWHLTQTSRRDYTYDAMQDDVRACGFDMAESIYAENLQGSWHDGSFSHNMEYMTAKAIEFIKDDEGDNPFFMYFNPTVPHASGNVLQALTAFDCTDTPAGRLTSEPVVAGMTQGTNCANYRQTVINRAGGDTSNNNIGSIWLDDAVGALIMALEETNKLDNTFFLFQMDHGQEGKSTLWEPGVRLAQFVHFPAEFSSQSFGGMVSTIDIGPTILDYAGIDQDSPGYFQMDGISWRQAIETEVSTARWNEDRCLFFEIDEDRAVRCGCTKYININGSGSTTTKGNRANLPVAPQVLLDVCDGSGSYNVDTNQGEVDIKSQEPTKLQEMHSILACHLERTRASQAPDYESQCGAVPDIVSVTPSPTPTSSPAPLLGFCFSGETTVQTRDGRIKMTELKLGDEVLVGENRFEQVYSFGHRHEHLEADYIQLLPIMLELSSNHMLFVKEKGMVPASLVELGDVLSNGKAVSGIRIAHREGVYAPFTASGSLMVNSVLASNYIAFQDSSLMTVGGLPTPFSFQWLAHSWQTPHRMLCTCVLDCTYESYIKSGLSNWVATPYRLFSWVQRQHLSLMAALLTLFVLSSNAYRHKIDSNMYYTHI